MTYPSQAQLESKLAELRAGDLIVVEVRPKTNSLSRIPWIIQVRCTNRSPWKAIYTRGGRTSLWWIGQAKTEATAEARATKILKRIQKVRYARKT